MRRIYAIAISLAMLVVTPGLASAEPALNAQQAVNIVIQRALSQRGVPFTYGGGGVSGPSRRPDTIAAPAPPASAPLFPAAGTVPGLPANGIPPALPAGPGLVYPPSTTTALADVAPVPAVDPSANVVGFDASGLIQYAFAGVGLKMPRSSGEQYKVGQKVLPSQALPGDLIFYGPDGTQSVALFIGNGQMVETADTGVTVSQVRTNDMTPYLTRVIG